MKRGQATLFIVLGIIVVSLVVVGYSFRERISTKASDLGLIKAESLPPQFEEKQAEIEGCLSSLLEEAIATASLQGGYADQAPTGYLVFAELPIAYYFDKGENKMPTRETVAAEIAKLMKDSAPSCAEGIGTEPKTSSVKVTIEDTKVTANVKMPVQVTLAENTKTISNFEASSKVALGTVLDVAKEIVDQQSSDPENLCLTCINDIATANGFKIKMESYEDGITLALTNKEITIEETQLKFKFAMRY